MNSPLSAFLERSFAVNNILFIVGPTAAGKTAFALEAAQRFNGEIVSCDAMQVYREANICSDKPSAKMRTSVPHHLLDVVSVEEEFNAAKYRALAVAAIEDILKRGRKAVVCGGGGMYMMAVLDGLFESVDVPAGVREALLALIAHEGLDSLYQGLQGIDPVAAAKINPNDQMRIVRALEVFEATGVPISRLQQKRDGLWGKQPIAILGVERPREVLYARAEVRIDGMFACGLVDEVRGLLRKKLSPSASRIIGIPEVKGFIEGVYGLDEAKARMKLGTRHYIKRQMTWFRKDKRIEWVSVQ